MTSRPYGGEADLALIVGFLSTALSTAPPGAYWHPGDAVWGMYQNTVFDARREVRLWEEDGELVGFGWLEEPDGVVMQVHPRLRGSGLLEREMLEWAARQTRAVYGERAEGELWTRVAEDDPRIAALLAELGFELDPDHALIMSRGRGAPVAEIALPDGWTVREVGGEGEWEERVEIHREVWHPSKVTLEAYRRLREAPGYYPRLDLVAVAPTVRSAPTAYAGSTHGAEPAFSSPSVPGRHAEEKGLARPSCTKACGGCESLVPEPPRL